MQLNEQEAQMQQELHQEAQNKKLTVRTILEENQQSSDELSEKLQILEELSASYSDRSAAFVKFFHETAGKNEEIEKNIGNFEDFGKQSKTSPWFPTHVLSTLVREEDSTDRYRKISNPYDTWLYNLIGRVHNQSQLNCSGQWIPNKGTTLRGREYLQIMLMDPENTFLCGIVARGRGDGKVANEFITKYKVRISIDGGKTWIPFQNDRIFDGNTDSSTKKVNYFLPVKCTHVRIYLWDWNNIPSLRAAIMVFRT
jgi:hypothetical protein